MIRLDFRRVAKGDFVAWLCAVGVTFVALKMFTYTDVWVFLPSFPNLLDWSALVFCCWYLFFWGSLRKR